MRGAPPHTLRVHGFADAGHTASLEQYANLSRRSRSRASTNERAQEKAD